MLKPIITEKSMKDAKKGKYTFLVFPNMTKYQIKKMVEEAFDVHVTSVRTMNKKAVVKRTMTGRRKTIKAVKKAIVQLADKEKIDVFETEK